MTKIDKHIEDLLHNHDCVIVPDFGGFITSKKEAYFNPFTSVFHPASKKILFNKHLVFNDGLLAAKVAESQSLSMEESQQILLQFKDDCFLRLNEEGRVEIEKVGVLFFDKEKNIQFQQASTNFLKDSFGLQSKSLKKIEVAATKPKVEVAAFTAVERPETTKVDRKVVAPVPTKKRRERDPNRIGRLIPLLLIPLMVGGAFLVSNELDVDYKKVNVANYNPFQNKYVEPYEPREENAFVIESQETVGKINNSSVEVLVEQPKEVIVKEIPAAIDSTYNESPVVSREKKYHVIAGCFSEKSNAEKLVENWQAKGNSAKIVDKKGRLHRVAIESFETRRAAKAFLKATKRDKGISLWILKK